MKKLFIALSSFPLRELGSLLFPLLWGLGGCTNAEASGHINADYHYGCLPSSLTLDSAGFTSTDTWARNGITISSPVTVTYCEKPDYSGGSSGTYKADCRSYNIVTTTHYFSWCFIKQYASQLCPSPWRVPTREDFCQYANGGIGADCSHTDSIQVGMDGWHNLGQIDCDGTYNDIPNVFAWSGSEFDTDIGFNAWASWEAGFTTSAFWEKCCGFILRCVR
jgi:hypothetical protein